MQYPTNVPEYNKFRYLSGDAIDLEDTTTLCVKLPQGFVYWFMGAISSLMDINMWEKYGTLTPEEMVDIANNEVIFMDCCDMIAGCIEESESVQEALAQLFGLPGAYQDAANNFMQQFLTGFSSPQSYASQFNDLDYVYGGLLNAGEEYDNAVNAFDVVATAAASAEDFLLNSLVPKYLTESLVEKLTEGFTLGISILVAFFQDPDTKQAFTCAIFDQICGRGMPYIIKPEDVNAGWDATTNLATFGITAISDMVQIFFSMDKYLQLFQVGSDEPDDDWTVLCGCHPEEDYTYEFTQDSGSEPNTAYGNTWTPVTGGAFVSGQGYHSTDVGAYTQVQIVAPTPSWEGQTVTRIEVHYSMPSGGASGATTGRQVLYTPSGATLFSSVANFSEVNSPTVVSSSHTSPVGKTLAINMSAGNEVPMIIERVIFTYQI